MQAVSFDYAKISPEVRDVLKKEFGPNVAIRTEEGNAGHVYVRIVSDRFDGLSDHAKQDKIWDVLRDNLHENAKAVSLVLAFGLDQI